jgi:hypothetical protein
LLTLFAEHPDFRDAKMSEFDDPELEALLRSLDDDDVPELARLGLLTESRIDYEPDFADVARKLAELRGAAEPHADEHGYLWEVTAAEVDEAARRAVWVEWKEKDTGRVVDTAYFLKARDGSRLVAHWEIETYNPYFGCRARFLGWHGDSVVFVYEDKHDTHVATSARGQDVRRAQIAPEWSVETDFVAYRNSDAGRVDRLALPTLEPLPPLADDEARRMGIALDGGREGG